MRAVQYSSSRYSLFQGILTALGLLFVPLQIVPLQNASADKLVKFNLKNRQATAKVAPADGNKVVFWTTSSGNISLPLYLNVSAPGRAKVQTFFATNLRTDSKTLRSNSKWQKLSFAIGKKRTHQFSVRANEVQSPTGPNTPGGPGNTPGGPGLPPVIPTIPTDAVYKMCMSLANSEVKALFESFLPGQSYSTKDEACKKIAASYQSSTTSTSYSAPEFTTTAATGTSDPAEEPASGSINLNTFFQKDACNKNTSYLIKIVVDLSGVDRQSYTGPLTVQLSAQSSAYKGSRASSIKPSSVGRFAGKPLALLSSVAPSAEKINLVKWSKGKVVSSRAVKIQDYVYYRSLVLTRSTIGEFLKGGTGTFEISNSTGTAGYGVCFKLVRARQSANGYPIG